MCRGGVIDCSCRITEEILWTIWVIKQINENAIIKGIGQKKSFVNSQWFPEMRNINWLWSTIGLTTQELSNLFQMLQGDLDLVDQDG